ncbi:MAG TPA: ATP-binding protein [Rhizomicrobium sp.]|jgi:PAS domain S-box-containing protein
MGELATDFPAQSALFRPTGNRLIALVGAVERLAGTRSLQEVIEVVGQMARAISGADGITFVLREGDCCHYVDENAVSPLWKGRRFSLTACISGWTMLHGEMAVVPDIYADARIPHDAYRPTFVKSLVMTPVKTTETIAAIGAYWAETRRFDETELVLLEALARSTAAALSAIQARTELSENEERLSMALNAGGLGACEVNLATGVLTASPMCKAMFGRKADEPFTPRDFVCAIHHADRPAYKQAFESALLSGEPFQTEFRANLPNGEQRWIRVRGRALADVNGDATRLAGVTLDITERRQAKERLEKLQSEIAHLGRLTEMGQMASALAHELNQPLAAATNYMAAARRFYVAGAKAEQVMTVFDKLDGQLVRTKEIIQRVSGFVKREDSTTRPEKIGPLVEEAVQLALLDSEHRGANIEVAAPRDLPAAIIDKVQIQQVLLNLLRNALEAMDGSPKREIRVSAQRVNGGIEISVADSGPGLAPEVAAHLFEPFTTTKSNGMGIGLSICRKIVEAQGGRLWHTPGANGGAVFSLDVPVASA